MLAAVQILAIVLGFKALTATAEHTEAVSKAPGPTILSHTLACSPTCREPAHDSGR